MANGSQTPDPDEDVLGWENGCWYNASIDVNRTDGLNRTERDAETYSGNLVADLIRYHCLSTSTPNS